jgi:hypothetical protein
VSIAYRNPFPRIGRGVAFLFLFLCCSGARTMHAQSDPTALLNQLNALMEQIQSGGDPCPYMAQFKSLLNQFANSSPDMYQAMKPSLDLINSAGDGCSADGSSASASNSASNANDAAGAGNGNGNGSGVFPPSGAASFDGADHPYCHDNAGAVVRRCTDENGVASCTYFAQSPAGNTAGEKWIVDMAMCPARGLFIGGTKRQGDVSQTNMYQCTPGTPITASVSQGRGSDGTGDPVFGTPADPCILYAGGGGNRNGGGNGTGSSGNGSGNGSNNGSSGSGSGNGSNNGSGNGSSGSGSGSGNGPNPYVPAISMSCITMDFNGPEHWDEYFNNCSGIVNLTFVFPNGTMGAIDPLAAGKPEGTGNSAADYQRLGGTPSLYPCPEGSAAVDPNGKSFTRPIPEYKCRVLGL